MLQGGKHIHLLNKNALNIYITQDGNVRTGQQHVFKIFGIQGAFPYKNKAT